jgi:hypothetical protein
MDPCKSHYIYACARFHWRRVETREFQSKRVASPSAVRLAVLIYDATEGRHQGWSPTAIGRMSLSDKDFASELCRQLVARDNEIRQLLEEVGQLKLAQKVSNAHNIWY